MYQGGQRQKKGRLSKLEEKKKKVRRRFKRDRTTGKEFKGGRGEENSHKHAGDLKRRQRERYRVENRERRSTKESVEAKKKAGGRGRLQGWLPNQPGRNGGRWGKEAKKTREPQKDRMKKKRRRLSDGKEP